MSKHRTRGTMWNRLLSGVLCLALALGLLPPAGLIQPAEAAHWADPYAQQLLEWGIMTPNLASNLGAAITRAEFVAMCNRAFGYKKLGGTPFVDVPSSEWYADDIDIAYNAGYFTGTTSDPENPTASPNEPLTREMAAVAVARNLMLQETVGESLGFTDSHDLKEWSRGLVATAVAKGVITGYDDGSFRPQANISRGEVAALLVRLIGTPVSTEGSHELGNVYGNVVINSSYVTLRNTTIVGDLYITGGVDLGRVLLENVTVLGKIVISGGGESHEGQSSVILRNVVADEMLVDSIIDQFVTISAYGLTDIPFTRVGTSAFLEDASGSGYGLQYIELDGDPGTLLQLSGNIKEVKNLTPFSDLQLVKGTAQKITIDEYARGSQVMLSEGTLVHELNLDVATLVTGKGDIKHLVIGAAGCDVDILPEEVTIREGLTAIIDGEVIGDLAAAALSSEPRLLAGYPSVTGVAPTQAEGLYAGNKPGTIYWAVSEMASGSVEVEDLITNPVYGGIIYANQAGSISAAAAKTEYGRQIAGLVPGGSYYLSAVMVDGRGNRSPLKVVSFTTPDDTVPAFVGDPYMSKETCETAQVTATANKNCVLYWALLTEKAAAPTPQEFKSGSVGSNFGYGSVNMVKNAPISITVNRNRLPEKTTFSLYLWLTDLDGVKSMAAPIRLVVKTPDETPPVVSVPIQTGVYEKTAGITFSINEAPATLYWAVVAEGDESFISSSADMTSLSTKIKVEDGATGVIASGSTPAKGANLSTLFTISGLDTEKTLTNNYIMYYVAKDAAGNYSERVGYIHIRTLDTKPPEVTQWFTSTVNNEPDGQPLANTAINLEFTEQVKGGSVPSTEISGGLPVTFLDFYNQVLASAGNSQTQREARNRMANELAAHITLYYQPRGGQPTEVKPRHVLEETGAGDNWIIDWRNAVISMDGDGHVTINLPNGGANPAIQLDSGATYYFEFKGVYDNAYKPNGLMGNRSGNYTLPKFTTAYAQVDMKPADLDHIDANPGTQASDTANNPYLGIRLDICIDVIPRSTSKVPDTEYWDMIIWSDTFITVDIYRQVTDDKGVKGNWEKLTGGLVFDVNSTAANAAHSLTEETGGVYGRVPETLKEGYSYRYGIHITHLNEAPEYDPTGRGDAIAWGAEIVTRYSLIAGSRNNVRNVSQSMDSLTPLYDSAVNSSDVNLSVSEIGTVPGTSETILTYRTTFRDRSSPEFQGAYPRFDAGSASVEITVQLTRAGIAHVVVAEATAMYPTLTGVGQIGANNDGRDTDNLNATAKKTALEGLLADYGRTYIPTSGPDRDAYKKYITYMSYEGDGDTLPATNYSTPYSSYITKPKENLGSSAGVFYPDNPITYQASEASVTIGGLKSETWYYVFFVLQGSNAATTSGTVECYRFRTTEVKTPSVVVSGTSSTATMTPSDDCTLYFALVLYSDLDDTIKNIQAGQTSSYLTQMMTRADSTSTTGKSQFDNQDADTKSAVAQYIMSQTNPLVTSYELPRDDTKTYPNGMVPGGTNARWDFDNEMKKNPNKDYVVLVAVRQVHGGNSGDDFGFGAVYPLRARDPEPPSLNPQATNRKPGVLKMSGQVENKANGTYSGILTLSFDKNIFFHDNSTSERYTVTYGSGTSTKKNLKSILGGDAVVLGHAEPRVNEGDITTQIILTISNITANESIEFFIGGYLCNSNDVTAGVLKLTFDPAIPVSYIYTDALTNTSITATEPGFWVSWGD